MNEYRRSPRKAAYVTIPVSNKMTGEVMGRIGNLSADGMLMVCDAPVVDGALFQLGFELTNAQGRPPPTPEGRRPTPAAPSTGCATPGACWAAPTRAAA